MTITIKPASPEDAAAWLGLQAFEGGEQAEEEVAKLYAQYQAAEPLTATNRHLIWQGEQAIGRYVLYPIGSVVELRSFRLNPAHFAEAGALVMQMVVEQARLAGARLIIAQHAATYSPLFLAAYFKQTTRTQMKRTLASWQPQPIKLPTGVSLRPARLDDEQEAARMMFAHYRGTFDSDFSSDHTQVQHDIRAIFGNEYSRFDPANSLIAEDEAGQAVGNLLFGDMGHSKGEWLAWVLDISLAAAWRGRGLGKAMLTQAINNAQAANYRTFGLMVTIGNWPAQSLYRSFGLREYGDMMYESMLRL